MRAGGLNRRNLLSAAAVAIAAAGAAAYGRYGASQGGDVAARFARYRVASEPNGVLAKVVWPSFVTDAPAEVKSLYEFQVTHGELMRWMPCFCGCGTSPGHRSNRDCYIKSVNSDGSVVFDSMAPT